MRGIVSDKLADKGNPSRPHRLNARESLQLWPMGVIIVLELLQALEVSLTGFCDTSESLSSLGDFARTLCSSTGGLVVVGRENEVLVSVRGIGSSGISLWLDTNSARIDSSCQCSRDARR